MSKDKHWSFTEEEKIIHILNLTHHLTTLRTQAGLSQEELASTIGLSRQSYGTIERNTRTMSWDTYLALIMFFDYHTKTHDLIRSLGCFPYDLIKKFNDDEPPSKIDINSFMPINTDFILSSLDEQAINNIKMIIMIEYARCTKTSGDAVVKAFDGVTFSAETADDDKTLQNAKPLKKRGRPRKNHTA